MGRGGVGFVVYGLPGKSHHSPAICGGIVMSRTVLRYTISAEKFA